MDDLPIVTDRDPPPPAHDGFDIATEYEALIQFMYMAPVGLAQIAPDGTISMINALSAQLLMPLSRDGTLENLYVALESVAPDLRARCNDYAPAYGMVFEELRLQISAGVPGKIDARILSLSVLKLDAQRLMAVLTDITQQVRRERQLKHNEAWFNAILTGITDYALVSLDLNGCITEWNPSIGRVTGFNAASTVGQPYTLFLPDGACTPDRLRDRLQEADADGWNLDDAWHVRADGSRFWGSAMIAPLRDRTPGPAGGTNALPTDELDQAAYCLVLRDITDKREASESQRRAVLCDHLTDIANRRAFFEAATREIDRFRRLPRPLSIVLFDADHFKCINDRHGHPVGDLVLRHIAAMLQSAFRPADVVARVGGEEFAVLLPSTDLQGAAVVAERARLALHTRPVVIDGVAVPCNISAGVAAMDDGLSGLDAMMKRADRALYAAKAAGRNRVVCWTPLLDALPTAAASPSAAAGSKPKAAPAAA